MCLRSCWKRIESFGQRPNNLPWLYSDLPGFSFELVTRTRVIWANSASPRAGYKNRAKLLSPTPFPSEIANQTAIRFLICTPSDCVLRDFHLGRPTEFGFETTLHVPSRWHLYRCGYSHTAIEHECGRQVQNGLKSQEKFDGAHPVRPSQLRIPNRDVARESSRRSGRSEYYSTGPGHQN